MLSRIMKICLFGFIAALIALFTISLHITSGNNNDLYLVMPKNAAEPGIDIRVVEKINEGKFMLTYMKESKKTAAVGNVSHDISLVWTNYTFPFVCKYQMINGGFFSKDNQEHKSNYAVLNKQAAFDLFGNMDITGFEFSFDDKKFVVKGVINDEEEEPKIYMPMMLSDGNPNTFLAELDEKNGITVEYVQNELKQAGVDDSNYNFFDLNLEKEKITGKAGISLLLLIIYIIILLLILCVRFFENQYRFLKSALKRHYFKDLLKCKPREIAGIFGSMVIAFALCTILVTILIHFLNLYLHWREKGNLLDDNSVYFNSFVAFQHLRVYVNWVFNIFIFFATGFFVYSYTWIRKKIMQ